MNKLPKVSKTIIAASIALLIGSSALAHSAEAKDSYFKAGVSSASIDLSLGNAPTVNTDTTGFTLQMGGKNMFGLNNLGHGLEMVFHQDMGSRYSYFLKPNFDIDAISGLNIYGKVGAGLWVYTNGGFAVSYGVGVDYFIGENFGVFFEYGATNAGDLSKTSATLGVSFTY